MFYCKLLLYLLSIIFIFGVWINICIFVKVHQLQIEFDIFLMKFNKSYTAVEYNDRFEIFKKSVQLVNLFNSARNHNGSALYGLTKYSDMNSDEFLSNIQMQPLNKTKIKEETRYHRSSKNIPLEIDWRDKGIITQINNQKSCGACWAFSTIQNIEAMNAIKTGKLERLSIQQMIDCSLYNNGCNGGDTCALLEWLKYYKVMVAKEKSYPLNWRNEECQLSKSTVGVQIKDFTCENFVDNEDLLIRKIASQGPVTVAVNAITWQNYLEGIIQFHCDSSPFLLNHAVQIVGYNISSDIPYYIIRNSWGEDFGDRGYLYVAIGSNMCGLANKVSSVTLI